MELDEARMELDDVMTELEKGKAKAGRLSGGVEKEDEGVEGLRRGRP